VSGRRPDEAIRPTPEDEPRIGTEHLPRVDIAALETAQPRLVDAALRGPVLLTRHGRDAFVLMLVDVFSRMARDAEARRLKGPPVIEG
jgi:hypothetical protein